MANSTSPQKPSRKGRLWLILAGLLVLAVIVASQFILTPERRPQTVRKDFPDYAAAMAKFPRAQSLRYPSQEELMQFPVLWPKRPLEENALGDYLNAMAALSSMPPPPGSLACLDSYDDNPAGLAEWIKAHEESLDAIQLAVQKNYFGSPVFVGPYQEGPVPDVDLLTKMRQLSRVCADAGFLAELENRPDEAAQWYLTSLNMGRPMRHGILIQNLVGIALTANGSNDLNRLIANASLADDTLKEIISFCESEPPLMAEINFTLDAEDEWVRANPAMKSGTAKLLAGHHQGMQKARKAFAAPLSEMLKDDDARSKLVRESGQSGIEWALWRWRDAIAKRQVRMEALRVRAAIALYENAHGKLPDALAALMPDILTHMPLDPYTGNPFQYKRDGTTWQLRSTGPKARFSHSKPGYMQLQGDFWAGDPEDKDDFDYIFVSTLDSNLSVRKKKHPKTDAAWSKLHPERTIRRPDGLEP